jgi:hypothetical protein
MVHTSSPVASRTRGALTALVTLAAAVALVFPRPALAFDGASLAGSTIPVTHGGSAYPRVSCTPGTDGFCTGKLKLTSSHRTIASVPVAIRGNDAPSVQVPLSRSAFALVQRSGRLKVRVTIRVHDTNGDWRTTTSDAYLHVG